MADLHHDSLPSDDAHDFAAERHNAQLGMVLFAAYLVVYGAYVLVNAFWASLMDQVAFAGLNVAVISGLGLIVGAFALALVYMSLCRSGKDDRP